mgnify:CR=1 FL=1|tara:strand:+ start:2354 stop:3610 length:1257 start_codon:yes stop_codon:yes gene_type:complete
MNKYKNSLAFARELDAKDPLAHFRAQFYIPQVNGKDVVYFTGNSLGLQPKTTKDYINQELEDWKYFGVEGHFYGKNPWVGYHHFVEKQTAEIVGAKIEEVVVMNSLTVNLNLLMVTFYSPTKTRYKIIMEADAFPSDHYAMQQQARFHGFDPEDAIVQLYPREGEHTLRTEDIIAEIKFHADDLALVMIGGVNYYTGQFFDLENIVDAGHSIGAIVGFDLAHAAGNVILKLHDWNVDFATWCSYKYLNSSPGGISGVFIHEKYSNSPELPRFAGWWGSDEKDRFLMDKKFIPQKGAAGWQMSNAPILTMSAHWASLEIFMEAGMENLRVKSIELTNYLEFLINDSNELGLEIITPSNVGERGCQLSLLTKENGKELFKKLQAAGVIADWREPNVIRIAPVPMYNTFEDCFRFVEILNS